MVNVRDIPSESNNGALSVRRAGDGQATSASSGKTVLFVFMFCRPGTPRGLRTVSAAAHPSPAHDYQRFLPMIPLRTSRIDPGRHTRHAWVLVICLAAAAAMLPSCGGKREIAPEERGTPNTPPPELVQYREARGAFLQWMKCFGRPDLAADAYTLLTARTRAALRTAGVADAKAYAAWLGERQARAETPFYFTFSGIDILDIDLRDSTRAIVTASFVADVPGRQIESIGSFFLLRERGAWKVPFGDDGTWQRSWWQHDGKFSTLKRGEGMARLNASSLGLDLLYPLTWDAADKRTFRVPGETAPQTGVELSYLNPGTMDREAVVRVWIPELPPLTELPAAQDSSRFVVLRKEDVMFTDGAALAGRVYTLADTKTGQVVKMFGGVNQALGTLANYQSVLTLILESITPQP